MQLIDADGAVLATSPNASRTLPVLPQDVLAGLSGVSTTDRSAYDDVARVAVQATTFQGEPATVVATVPLTEVQGVLDALRVALAVVVPLLTVALGLVVWLILGRALRPVEELRRGAALVASSGGPGSLPVPARDDELGALARTLNSMLDRLEAGAARQRAFVADAAHELRSPLAALRTSIEVARAHPQSYRTDELAAELEGEVLRMQALVDDLLLLARVGSTPTVLEELDLGAVARDVVRPPSPSPSPAPGTPAGTPPRSAACCATSSTTPSGTRGRASSWSSPTGPCGWTTTVPGSTRPTVSGCSSGSCGSTRHVSATRAAAGWGSRSPARSRASRAATSCSAPPTWAVCGPSCGCRVTRAP